jgi:hypothetical protein
MRCYGLFVILIVWCIGCGGFGPGLSDFDYPLAGNYQLNRTSSHEITITPKDGWTDETPIIRAKVVEVAWNDRFILAKRQGLKFRGSFPGDKYELPDPDKFDFWILDTQGPKLFGPFDESEFANKRNEMKISESLILKDVYSYR